MKILTTTIFCTSLGATLLLMTGVCFGHAIQAFSISAMPFRGNQAKSCYLDSAREIPKGINAQLKEGRAYTNEQIKNRYGVDFKKMSNAYLCQYKAEKDGISKIPAIVFDHKYVVYGIRDIQRAVQIVDEYEENKA
jgi:integrating conjugative element protein (TIGR03757 family)